MDKPDPSFLAPTTFIDSEHPAVVAFARETIGGAKTDAEKTARLFTAVRDRLRYDPWTATFDPLDYTASHLLEQKGAYCIPKSVLMAAAARAVGLPARLGFADVTNHLSTPKLLDLLGTDLFVWHGFTEVWVDGTPYKLTTAFNASLCEKFGTKVLAFDATNPADALLQPTDGEGRKYMEYVEDRGRFVDLPFEEIKRAFDVTYPKWSKMLRRGEAYAAEDAFTQS